MSQKRQEQFEVSRYPLEKSSRLASLELKSKTLKRRAEPPSHSVQKWTAVLFWAKSVANCQEGVGDVERKIRRAATLIKSQLNPYRGKLDRVLPKERDEEVFTQSWCTEIQPTSAPDPGGVLVIAYETIRTCVCKNTMMHAGSVLKCYWPAI